MSPSEAEVIGRRIFDAAVPVLSIEGFGGNRWKRNVAKGGRIGPWLCATYRVLDDDVWRRKGACLYLVGANDGGIRYTGMSRNGLKHRWRTSPAYDAETMVRLGSNQLFHSQCWKHIEEEYAAQPGVSYEVRSIEADKLVTVLEKIGAPLSAFAALRDDGESVVASVERWLCNHRSARLARWNVAMTGDALVTV